MTNTNNIIIIPASVDTRPTSYSYSFENEHGVGIDVTVNTRDEGIAQKVASDLNDKLGWRNLPRGSDRLDTAVVPFAIAAGLFVLGVLIFAGVAVLMFVDWLPAIRVDGYRLDAFDTVTHILKLYTKGALIAWLPLSIIGMIFNHHEKKRLRNG